MVKDEVAEAQCKYLDVNEYWQQKKNIMMETAQVTYGLSKGLFRHKETWWWNQEVAKELREKKKSIIWNTHTTQNRFTAFLEFVWDHPGEQVPER